MGFESSRSDTMGVDGQDKARGTQAEQNSDKTRTWSSAAAVDTPDWTRRILRCHARYEGRATTRKSVRSGWHRTDVSSDQGGEELVEGGKLCGDVLDSRLCAEMDRRDAHGGGKASVEGKIVGGNGRDTFGRDNGVLHRGTEPGAVSWRGQPGERADKTAG